MSRVLAWRAACVLLAAATLHAAVPQHKPAPKPAPKPATKTAAKAPAKAPVTKTDPVDISCLEPLGQGVKSGRKFCDVMAGRDPARGNQLKLPAHHGTAVLQLHLYNRQMYSAQQVQAGQAYTKATATIGVLTADGTVLGRGVVQTEFRTGKDLFDRITGGAGPSGLKAVAPVGDEIVRVDIPEKVDVVSLLGEKLVLSGVNGPQTLGAEGRPIALVSDAQLEYQPPPVKKAAPVKKRKK